MRFLVDECTGPAVARWLREQSHEVFSVYEEARGMSDDDILATVATAGGDGSIRLWDITSAIEHCPADTREAIDRLAARDDARYQQWRSRVSERRFARPVVERRVELQGEIVVVDGVDTPRDVPRFT